MSLVQKPKLPPNPSLEPFEEAGSERKEFDAFNASKAGGRGCGRQPSPLVHLIASIGLMAALGSAADAAIYQLDFEVTNFEGVFGSSPTPTDPVTGSIIWEAGGIRDPIQSFDSIYLILDGHTYGAGEIGYSRLDFPYSGIELIGGTITGIGSMSKFTDDFWLRWDRNSLTPFDFSYTSSQRYGFWSAYESNPGSFTSFSITEVPEPAFESLVLLGLVALLPRRNRPPRPRS
jgi:hypothetical protein